MVPRPKSRSSEAGPNIRPTAVHPLELFPNPDTRRPYEIDIRCPEFTSVCPRTGQPDFGEIRIIYVPRRLCIELKSLKLYLQGFRNQGIFYEAVTNQILSDLVTACQPAKMEVVGDWRPRGGITTKVTARYEATRTRGKKSPEHSTSLIP
jgi:7-cyano-7-deazaguanine reductase